MMASSVVGALRVTLGIDSAAFEKGAKTAKSSLGRLGSAFTKLGAVAAAGITAAAGALSVAMGSISADADKIAKAAQKLGIASDELQKLRYTADLSGVSFESLQTGIVKLTQSMSDVAKGGTTDAVRAFKALGVEVKNADGGLKTSDQVIAELADKFASYRDGAEKTALAVALFGKAGAQMIPLLNQGAEAIQKAKDEAAELGTVMSTELQSASERTNDNWTRLKAVFHGIWVQIAERLMPAIADLTDRIIVWAKKTNAAERFGNIFADMFRTIAHHARDAMAVMQKFAIVARGIYGVLAALSIDDQQNRWDAIKNSLSDMNKKAAEVTEQQKKWNKAREEYLRIEKGIGDLGDEWGGGWNVKPPPKPSAPVLSKGGSGKAKGAKAGAEKKNPWDTLVNNAKRYIETQKALKNSLGRTAEAAAQLTFKQDLLNKAGQAGIKVTPKQSVELDKLALAMALAKVAAAEAKANFEFAKGATLSFIQTLRQGLQNGEKFWKAFGNSALNVINKIIDRIEKQLVDALFSLGSAGSGGGGIFGAILGGIGSLFSGGGGASSLSPFARYANGGQFKVGGAGGIDSQLVAFHASPNETVSVTKPGQSFESGGRQEITVRGVFVDDGGIIKARIDQTVQQAAPVIVGAAVGQVNRNMPGLIANTQRRIG